MNIFVISDTHFFHKNILTFTKPDGTFIRPGFESVEEMNEHIIEKWNSVVKDTDEVIHLGDVTFHDRKISDIMYRLNGRKHLILGNHDNVTSLQKYFVSIRSWFTLPKSTRVPIVFTHFPLHESSFKYKGNDTCLNVHGHIHEKNIPDERYVNVSVEQCNYIPVALEDIMDGVYNPGKSLDMPQPVIYNETATKLVWKGNI